MEANDNNPPLFTNNDRDHDLERDSIICTKRCQYFGAI